MEITLGDLLVLEPRLACRTSGTHASKMATEECRVVSWSVSARTTAPHLPLLRGGEVVLVPSRVTAVVGRELPALLREATLRDTAAVVFERGEQGTSSLDFAGDAVPVLDWDGDLTGETETAINRLLTECRGNLYRVGSELERQMTDLAASRAGLNELVRTASELSGLIISVTDAQGRLLVASPQDPEPSDTASPAADQSRVERELP